MELRPEAADEYAYYDGASCETELYGYRDTRDGDRYGSYDELEYHADEDCGQVGVFEVGYGVAHHGADFVDGVGSADNGQAVAKLQYEVGACQQPHAGPRHARDVYGIKFA